MAAVEQTIVQVARRNRLSASQRKAFYLMARPLAARHVAELIGARLEDFPVYEQAMVLTGQGGSGKSYIIKAFNELAALLGRSRWVLNTAYTATAAIKLPAGETLHSALGLGYGHGESARPADESQNEPSAKRTKNDRLTTRWAGLLRDQQPTDDPNDAPVAPIPPPTPADGGASPDPTSPTKRTATPPVTPPSKIPKITK